MDDIDKEIVYLLRLDWLRFVYYKFVSTGNVCNMQKQASLSYILYTFLSSVNIAISVCMSAYI